MFSEQLVAAANAARRALPSLGLAAALLTSTLGAPAPAVAQEPIIHDHRMGGPPVARVQVVIHQVKIIDDRDWGDGEFYLWYTLVCAEVTAKCMGYGEIFLDGYETQFSAGSGETHTLNQLLPIDGSPLPHYDATAETGYALYPGHNYRLRFGMEERDSITNRELMGDFKFPMTPESGWGIGTYTLRSVHNDDSPGDFEVTFEVRRVPLADLRPVNIKVSDLPGSTKKRVCMPVQNVEPGNAGPFEVLLRVDDAVLPDARTTVPGLTPGNATEACVETQLPDSGQHLLEAVVDPANALLEYNEANNVYQQTYTAAQQPATTATPRPGTTSTNPASGPGAAQADLTVSAIKANGRVLDDKADCKDGKYAMTVVVKNAGAEKAGAFGVRLAVDGEEVAERPVSGLEAGQEREVRVEDVRLKKGERKLAATVDPMNPLTESTTDNNELKITVQCKGDG
jgi:hypothetical protein